MWTPRNVPWVFFFYFFVKWHIRCTFHCPLISVWSLFLTWAVEQHWTHGGNASAFKRLDVVLLLSAGQRATMNNTEAELLYFSAAHPFSQEKLETITNNNKSQIIFLNAHTVFPVECPPSNCPQYFVYTWDAYNKYLSYADKELTNKLRNAKYFILHWATYVWG